MISVKSESERIEATKTFINQSIEELEREIKGCDYEEDPNGSMVYSPDCYSYEKRLFEAEKNKLEIVLVLLTREVPFSVMEW